MYEMITGKNYHSKLKAFKVFNVAKGSFTSAFAKFSPYRLLILFEK